MRQIALATAFAALLVIHALPSITLARQRTSQLQQGRLVRLAVEPRDPRDLFRGEYSVLAYEIGRLQGTEATSLPSGCNLSARESCRVSSGTPAYVRLVPDAEGVHRAAEVRFSPGSGGDLLIAGQLGSGTLVRRGAPLGAAARRNAGAEEPPRACASEFCLTGTVSYGIETWYGPQGRPAKLDRVDRNAIRVEARVADDGAAVLSGIVVDGQTFAATARLW